MKIYHITLVILGLFLSLIGCEKLHKEKEIVIENNDFKWTVTIPKKFYELPEKDWDKVEEKGMEAIEKVYGEEVENRATTLFAYKNGKFHTFESNYQIFDSKTDRNYSDSNKEVNIMTFKTFEETIPNATMDSISSKQMISGLEFERFEINLNLPNNIKMTTVGFSRLFGDKDFTINIVYINDKIGNELIANILNSKFE